MKKPFVVSLTCLLFFIFLSLLFGVGYVYNDRFRLCHILTPGEPPIHETIPDHASELSKLLSQEFTYLDRGNETYVFESADGTTVLKFFRQNRFRASDWLLHCPLPPFLTKVMKKRLAKKEWRQKRLERSCRLAFDELREETGLLYLQLEPTCALGQRLRIRDRLGRLHAIESDTVAFMVQRKATLLFPYLQGEINSGDLTRAKATLSRLISYLKERYARGIVDEDASLKKNMGIIDGEPIAFDVGRFTKKKLDYTETSQEMRKITKETIEWLDLHSPELSAFFKRKLYSPLPARFANLPNAATRASTMVS